MIITDAVAVASFTEVAVIVAVPVAEEATKVAAVVETPDSVVQAAPVHAQVTPAAAESLATAAVKATCWPESIIWAAFGVSETVTFPPEVVQPDNTRITAIASSSDRVFIGVGSAFSEI